MGRHRAVVRQTTGDEGQDPRGTQPLGLDLATGASKSSSTDDVSRYGCGWSDRGSYSAGFPGQREASKMQQCERHGSVAPMQDSIERCAWCNINGVFAKAQRSEREHLSVTKGASASGVFLA